MSETKRLNEVAAGALYSAEARVERLEIALKAIEQAIMDVTADDFRFARKTPTWMEGFTCAKVAAAAAARKVTDEI